jgi:hypothetical protein
VSAASDHEVSELDLALAADGEWIELQRLIGAQLIPIKVRCRAFVRTLDAKDLVGNIKQDTSEATISPTEIIRSGWPGPNSSATPTNQDRRVPRSGDKAVIQGKPRNIEVALPIYVDNGLVRIKLRVLG